MHNILISLSGDVQLNAGPKNKSYFRICLNVFLYMSLEVKSIMAHNYAKTFFHKGYNADYKFHIVCIFEKKNLTLVLRLAMIIWKP